MKTKKYIAGPMTGYENYNFDRFYDVERKMIEMGYEVVNPARITDAHGGQKLFLEDKNIMKDILEEQQNEIRDNCNEIVLLEGWQKSVGSKIELKLALENNLSVSLITEYIQ